MKKLTPDEAMAVGTITLAATIIVGIAVCAAIGNAFGAAWGWIALGAFAAILATWLALGIIQGASDE